MTCHYDFVSKKMLNETRRLTSYSHKIDIKLTCHFYENAIVVPSHYFFSGGVIGSNGDSINSSAFNEKFQVEKPLNTECIVGNNKMAIYFGFFHNVWGHCLTDTLKKIWYLYTDECQELIKNGAELIYITPNNEPLSERTKEILGLAKVPVNQMVHVISLTRFEKVYVPDNSLICKLTSSEQDEYFFTNEFLKIYELIKSNITFSLDEGLDKVYFSRTHLKNNVRDFGESTIERQFKKKGFVVVHPQELPFKEQLNILCHCREFASTEGSISHNAIFCNPGTKIYLVRKSYYVNGYQNVISEIANLDVTYIDAHNSLPYYQFSKESGPFYMCVTPEFEQFVGYRIFHLPLWMCPSWWWYCNRNRKIVHKIFHLLGRK